MSRDTLLGELVSRYLERQRQGQPVSPEELCARHPELLDDLKTRLRALASMESFLDLNGDGRSAGEAAREGLGRWPLGDTNSEAGSVDGAPFPTVAGYRIEVELGKGGMGVVYRAQQLTPRRRVALKMILGGRADAEQRARFLKEVQAQAGLEHPNVVRVYEVGEHDSGPYFSAEYVEGGNLDKRINGVPQPAKQSAEWLETLARAMHVAHERGIVHRDLKPANVLLAADGTLKITDFGLAKLLEVSAEEAHAGGLTPDGAIMGTPSYMAPEQAAGKTKAVGPAADVYALGAILYECLTGRPPFRGETVLDTLQQVLHAEPVLPRRLNPKVPRDLETICLKCLRKEPCDRYASAAVLAEDLRRFQKGEPIQARPIRVWERAIKWVKRRPAAAAALVAISVVTVPSLVILGLSSYQASQEKVRAEEQEIEKVWYRLLVELGRIDNRYTLHIPYVSDERRVSYGYPTVSLGGITSPSVSQYDPLAPYRSGSTFPSGIRVPRGAGTGLSMQGHDPLVGFRPGPTLHSGSDAISQLHSKSTTPSVGIMKSKDTGDRYKADILSALRESIDSLPAEGQRKLLWRRYIGYHREYFEHVRDVAGFKELEARYSQ